MLTLNQLLKSTWLLDLENSKSVSIIEYKTRGTSSERRVKSLRFQTRTLPTVEERKKGHKNRLHSQRVYMADPSFTDKFSDANGIKVSCNCERFKFWYEVALARKGAADIIYSNGELPVNTNPTMKIGLCKHLVKVLRYIKKKQL